VKNEITAEDKFDARKVTIKTPTTKIRRTTSHIFYQTSHVCEKETTSKAQKEREKLAFDLMTQEYNRLPPPNRLKTK
jgi:hypothetical protein